MSLSDISIPLLFVIAITIATIGLGLYATRAAKTASDFFVAGRGVSVSMNASAISGEYLSAASFMGIAGLVMKNGYDALWYPVGYAAGYLLLLLFIAGPLRRFGAYTIPDFAEGRFDSPGFRKIAVVFVLCIGLFYTMPQMRGAGLTMQTIMGWPYYVGILVVGGVITFNVALGGMKGITFVQAFQYWAKAFAITVPVFVLMAVYGGYNSKVGENLANPGAAPKLDKETTFKYPGKEKAPVNALTFSPLAATFVEFPNGAQIDKAAYARKPEPREDAFQTPPVLPIATETVPQVKSANVAEKNWRNLGFDPPVSFGTDATTFSNGSGALALPIEVSKNNSPVLKNGKPIVTSGKIEFATPTEVTIPAGSYLPNAQTNKRWIEPYGTLSGKYGYPLLYTYSLIIALVCGTAGLPHILVRFYTNPDGRAAKRTTFWVMVLLGMFYVFTPVWGALGRALDPALYAVSNKPDSVVIALPMLLQNKLLGQILSGITSAGAFAAFMSTFSGLLVSMSGAFAHDIYGKILRPNASATSRLTAFKVAAVFVGIISMGLGLLVESFDIALLVGWAFAIAAASYFPLLLLGAWWRGLTRQGAAWGMLTGGILSLSAIACFMALQINPKLVSFEIPPLIKGLMEQPAIWGVPLSITIMVVVSLLTRRTLPADVDMKMLRLHAPEEMGLSKNYVE